MQHDAWRQSLRRSSGTWHSGEEYQVFRPATDFLLDNSNSKGNHITLNLLLIYPINYINLNLLLTYPINCWYPLRQLSRREGGCQKYRLLPCLSLVTLALVAPSRWPVVLEGTTDTFDTDLFWHRLLWHRPLCHDTDLFWYSSLCHRPLWHRQFWHRALWHRSPCHRHLWHRPLVHRPLCHRQLWHRPLWHISSDIDPYDTISLTQTLLTHLSGIDTFDIDPFGVSRNGRLFCVSCAPYTTRRYLTSSPTVAMLPGPSVARQEPFPAPATLSLQRSLPQWLLENWIGCGLWTKWG